MTRWKDVKRRVGKSAGGVRRGIGTVIERLEQRTLLASTPVMDWSSYLGGDHRDRGFGIAIDGSDNAWVTGDTASTDFASGGFDTTLNGSYDGFVAKINADGTLAWSSYLGGSSAESSLKVAIDGQGNAWVTGITGSSDLASGGFDTTYHGSGDNFVAKINADGALAWVSYLGGSAREWEPEIAIDGAGNAWVTGTTESTDLATGGFDTSYNGGVRDGFVAKINADGTLAWSSYLGGNGEDACTAIAIDASGNAWLTGLTMSSDFANGGFDTTLDGLSDAFVAKINANGTLGWSSYLYLGSTGTDIGSAIAVDGSGDAWVLGGHGSLAKINANRTLAWSRSDGEDRTYRSCNGIAIDDNDNAWITGADSVPDMPPNASSSDAFVGRISATGTWTWLAYIGGPTSWLRQLGRPHGLRHRHCGCRQWQCLGNGRDNEERLDQRRVRYHLKRWHGRLCTQAQRAAPCPGGR